MSACLLTLQRPSLSSCLFTRICRQQLLSYYGLYSLTRQSASMNCIPVHVPMSASLLTRSSPYRQSTRLWLPTSQPYPACSTVRPPMRMSVSHRRTIAFPPASSILLLIRHPAAPPPTFAHDYQPPLVNLCPSDNRLSSNKPTHPASRLPSRQPALHPPDIPAPSPNPPYTHHFFFCNDTI